jgi:hypothetical protein
VARSKSTPSQAARAQHRQRTSDLRKLSISSSSTIHFLVHSRKLSLTLTMPERVPPPEPCRPLRPPLALPAPPFWREACWSEMSECEGEALREPYCWTLTADELDAWRDIGGVGAARDGVRLYMLGAGPALQKFGQMR